MVIGAAAAARSRRQLSAPRNFKCSPSGLRSPVLHPGPAQLVSVLPVLYSERAVHLTLRPGPVLASKPANALRSLVLHPGPARKW